MTTVKSRKSALNAAIMAMPLLGRWRSGSGSSSSGGTTSFPTRPGFLRVPRSKKETEFNTNPAKFLHKDVGEAAKEVLSKAERIAARHLRRDKRALQEKMNKITAQCTPTNQDSAR